MAKLADAQRSGRCARKGMEVQILSRAPNWTRVGYLELKKFAWLYKKGHKIFLMKKSLAILSILLISLAFVAPTQASASTSAGVKPGSFFYFFDTTFENISLFFTFNSENKARKALGYANERLAEIEAIAEEKNPDAVKTAIANYESNIALATKKSKEVKDKGQVESLLTLIEDSSSKNQEILNTVLIKVPEEAREVITRAIEASKKNQEEITKQLAELNGEVEQLKKEVVELKSKEEANTKTNEELNKQKSKNTSTPAKTQTSPVSEIPLKPTPPVNTVVDICKNIEGTQTTIPTGMRWDNNQNCIASEQNVQPVPIVDFCNNIEGAQSYVPSGMTRNTDGNCIVPPVPTPTPTPTPAPIITPVAPIVPGSISVSVSASQLNNKGDAVDVIALVKDISGNLLSNQTVIFQSENSSAVAVSNTAGVAKVRYISDQGCYGGCVFKEADILAKVLVPGTTDTFISNKTKINAPYVPSAPQQGHLE